MNGVTSGQGSNWGRWGDQDERGALNLQTAETVLAALTICQTGKLYRLGTPIQHEGMPAPAGVSRPEALRLTLRNQVDEASLAVLGAPGGIGAVEDVISFPSHAGTHVDALCHIYADGTIYNGFSREEATTLGGAARCGIEKAGPLITRGVLLDVAAALGVRALEPEYTIIPIDIEAALDRQGLELRRGDAVLIRTGWLEDFLASEGEATAPQPGIGLEAARLIADADVMAIGADNSGIERIPGSDEFIAVHRELLIGRGVYMIEHLRLEALAEDECNEFLFGACPLPVVGAAGSPVDPFAIG